METQFSKHECDLVAQGTLAISDLLPDIVESLRKLARTIPVRETNRQVGLVQSEFSGRLALLSRRLLNGDLDGFVRGFGSAFLDTSVDSSRDGEAARMGQIFAQLAAIADMIDVEIKRRFTDNPGLGFETRMAFAKLRSASVEAIASVQLRVGARRRRTQLVSVTDAGPRTAPVLDFLQPLKCPAETPDGFRIMVEQNADYGILFVDRDSYIKTWNRGAERMLGYHAEEAINRSFATFYVPQDRLRDSPVHALRHAERFGRFEDIVSQRRKDGSVFLAHMILTAVRGVGAGLSGFVQTLRDVTDEERANDQLRRSEEKFRAFFEHNLDAMAINRLSDNRYVDVNEALLKLYGFSREEIIGRTPAEIQSWSDAEDLDQFLGTLARSRSINNLEVSTRGKDGTAIPVLLSSNLVSIGGERFILSIAHDITERKRFEVELGQSRAAAQEASRTKSFFLANISHEIRTPLNILLGCADEIADQLDAGADPGLRPLVGSAKRAAQRLLSTVNAMVEMSRIENHVFVVSPRRLKVAPVLNARLRDLAGLANDKGVTVRVQIDAPDASIEFDEQCLRGAITELLTNAIKFTESGGEIALRQYRDSAGILCLQVRDSGIGIAPEYLPHLFEPFSQESTGDTRRYQGAGLGLALVKCYLDLNGASVTVQSEKGRGSTFTVSFRSDMATATRKSR